MTSEASASAEPEASPLVDQAVSFLQHPKTQGSPLAGRVMFLREKGLTEAQVDQALRRCGLSLPAPPAQVEPAAESYAVVPSTGGWASWASWGAWLVGGAATLAIAIEGRASAAEACAHAEAAEASATALTTQLQELATMTRDVMQQQSTKAEKQATRIDKLTRTVDAHSEREEHLKEMLRMATRELASELRHEIRNELRAELRNASASYAPASAGAPPASAKSAAVALPAVSPGPPWTPALPPGTTVAVTGHLSSTGAAPSGGAAIAAGDAAIPAGGDPTPTAGSSGTIKWQDSELWAAVAAGWNGEAPDDESLDGPARADTSLRESPQPRANPPSPPPRGVREWESPKRRPVEVEERPVDIVTDAEVAAAAATPINDGLADSDEDRAAVCARAYGGSSATSNGERAAGAAAAASSDANGVQGGGGPSRGTPSPAADFVPKATDALLNLKSSTGANAWAQAAKADGSGQGGAPRIAGGPAAAASTAKPWERESAWDRGPPRLPGTLPPGFGPT